MVDAGIKCNKEVISMYEQHKMTGGTKTSPYDYLIFSFSDDMKYVEVKHAPAKGTSEKINQESDAPAEYQCMERDLSSLHYAFAVYNFQWKTKEGGDRSYVYLITFSDDDGPDRKKKMVMSSTQKSIGKALNISANFKITINDTTDLKYENVISEVRLKH